MSSIKPIFRKFNKYVIKFVVGFCTKLYRSRKKCMEKKRSFVFARQS
jgi:hypothetical protein